MTNFEVLKAMSAERFAEFLAMDRISVVKEVMLNLRVTEMELFDKIFEVKQVIWDWLESEADTE